MNATDEDWAAFEETYHRYYGFPKKGEGSPNTGPCYHVARDLWEGALLYLRSKPQPTARQQLSRLAVEMNAKNIFFSEDKIVIDL